MKFFLISDNVDTYTGMRLAGIDGVVVHTPDEVRSAIDTCLADKDIAILLITEKLSSLCPDIVSSIKASERLPLIVEMPDRHGTGRSPDSITRYVREAIGIRI